MANKIKYGLRNVYYAKITTVSSAGTPTYGTPVSIPGAVNLSMSASGEGNDFYADDTVYFHSESNNGYSGTLEMALLTDDFKKDVLGELSNAAGAKFEKADAPTSEFALMFEFQGDANATRHLLYRCTASRPDVAGATKEANITPQTETLNLTALPRLDNAYVKARVEATATTVYNGWFTTVYTGVAS